MQFVAALSDAHNKDMDKVLEIANSAQKEYETTTEEFNKKVEAFAIEQTKKQQALESEVQRAGTSGKGAKYSIP